MSGCVFPTVAIDNTDVAAWNEGMALAFARAASWPGDIASWPGDIASRPEDNPHLVWSIKFNSLVSLS